MSWWFVEASWNILYIKLLPVLLIDVNLEPSSIDSIALRGVPRQLCLIHLVFCCILLFRLASKGNVEARVARFSFFGLLWVAIIVHVGLLRCWQISILNWPSIIFSKSSRNWRYRKKWTYELWKCLKDTGSRKPEWKKKQSGTVNFEKRAGFPVCVL